MSNVRGRTNTYVPGVEANPKGVGKTYADRTKYLKTQMATSAEPSRPRLPKDDFAHGGRGGSVVNQFAANASFDKKTLRRSSDTPHKIAVHDRLENGQLSHRVATRQPSTEAILKFLDTIIATPALATSRSIKGLVKS